MLSPQATGYASPYIWCLSQARINWEFGRVAAGRASGIKMGDEGGGPPISSDGVAHSVLVEVSASDISPRNILVQKISSGTGSAGKGL